MNRYTMESNNEEGNMTNVCRLCDENSEKMHSIFDKNDEGRQILHLIKDCLPIIVYRTDPLSKQVCEKCYNNLNALWSFRKRAVSTAENHKEKLSANVANGSERVQLFLGCQESNDGFDIPMQNSLTEASTSTRGLTVLCTNCRNAVLDPNSISELELCTDLHKAIADSLKKNNVITESESEKMLRSRRKRSQAFYHELDDSLCSSLTEFTNTESSQCLEFQSEEEDDDDESYESEQDVPTRATKRRRLDPLSDEKADTEELLVVKKLDQLVDLTHLFIEKFAEEEEMRYYPLSLLQLSLNVINQNMLSEYQPDDFFMKLVQPRCSYCNKEFINSKILALHEVNHISIELGEKVDNPIPWHESRDDAEVRNKWLTSCDENSYEDNMSCTDEQGDNTIESLLIPIGTEIPQEHKSEEDIVLVDSKPMVNGIALADYTKDERKAFYATMRIGGVNKKFCRLCRYSFKDNWAIESHYFSSACYYTCRYCGMRFNKQRHRFKEHVDEHEQKNDPLSDKVYAARKLSNVVPKVLQSNSRVKKVVEQPDMTSRIGPLRVKSLLQRKSLQPNLQIKEEPGLSSQTTPPPSHNVQTSQSKTGNQAYFCRKCYKVFFKLDEFNSHSKTCEFNTFPALNAGTGKSPFNSRMANFTSNGEMSQGGRPVRNAAKEARAHKDDGSNHDKDTSSPQSFVCFICNTPFPTIYSRNSHMRIHKGETAVNSASQKAKVNSVSPNVNSINSRDSSYSLPKSSGSFQEVTIKQEPLEPEVEIHESENFGNAVNSVGAVSITPISKNPLQKPTINPNIMKLVQNNPHLTIKGSGNAANANNSPDRFQSAPSSSNQAVLTADADKSYKCSNCWEAFANKSHLYFHKKNQCEGSRFPCPFCKKRFGTEAAYSSHIFYSHPE